MAGPLVKLPLGVADTIIQMVSSAAKATSAERAKDKAGAKAAKEQWEQLRTQKLHAVTAGLGVDAAMDDVTWMIWAAAWRAANTQAGYTKDAAADAAKVSEHAAKAKEGGLAPELVDHIQQLADLTSQREVLAAAKKDPEEIELGSYAAPRDLLGAQARITAIDVVEGSAEAEDKDVVLKSTELRNSSDVPVTSTVTADDGALPAINAEIPGKAVLNLKLDAGFDWAVDSATKVDPQLTAPATTSKRAKLAALLGTRSSKSSAGGAVGHSVTVAPGTKRSVTVVAHQHVVDAKVVARVDIAGVEREVKGSATSLLGSEEVCEPGPEEPLS